MTFTESGSQSLNITDTCRWNYFQYPIRVWPYYMYLSASFLGYRKISHWHTKPVRHDLPTVTSKHTITELWICMYIHYLLHYVWNCIILAWSERERRRFLFILWKHFEFFLINSALWMSCTRTYKMLLYDAWNQWNRTGLKLPL